MAKKQDLSIAKIRYLLSETGYSFTALDRKYNLRTQVCRNAAECANIKGEHVIAKTLKLHPKDIWPSRYDARGKRLKPQPYDNYIKKPIFRQGLKAA
ncbi:MAG: helix-turn-helix domain-containing protein [Rhizobiales bacterium]|nr:helix-turn-helix domain-containing protein [Hyphomicrobiales bacterium]